MRNTETVITSLAKQWINEERTEMSAGIELQNLADMPYSNAIELLKKARKRLINIQMQRELVEEDEEFNDRRFEAEYKQGVSA